MRSNKISAKAGLPPGSLVYVGKPSSETPQIQCILYNAHTFQQSSYTSTLPQLTLLPDQICWLHIAGLHDLELIQQIGSQFSIHPLFLEDIVNTQQRPILHIDHEQFFLSSKQLHYDTQDHTIHSQHIALFWHHQLVITFQENTTIAPLFARLSEQLAQAHYKVRSSPASFLVYRLFDSLIDSYFPIIEAIGDNLEDWEETVFNSPNPETLRFLQRNKTNLLHLRKSVFPLRDIVQQLRHESILAQTNNHTLQQHLHDLTDHILQITETIELYREMNSHLKDMYLSSLSFRMNKIMQTLTIISLIFIPLSFLAGLYGMNFDYMPELHWKYGYFVLLAAMFFIAVSLIWAFKRKKWF